MTDNITIALVGDIMLGRSFRKLDSSEAPFSEDILRIFEKADIVAGNLETTITNTVSGEKGKTFLFRMRPEHAHWLRNFDYLSIANNHILDYGYTGMVDTMKHLDSMKIIHTGAGKNVHDARQLKVLIYKGQQIGFISATDHYDYWQATQTHYGVNYIVPSAHDNFLAYVKKCSAIVDHLIVYLHWGPNKLPAVPKWMKIFARQLVDNGVRVIAGTSPHHILPVERYRNGVIFYSLGDFIDDYAVDPVFRNDIGLIGLVTLVSKKHRTVVSEVRVAPIVIENLTVRLLNY